MKSTYGIGINIVLFSGEIGWSFTSDDGRGNWPWVEFGLKLWVVDLYITIEKNLKI